MGSAGNDGTGSLDATVACDRLIAGAGGGRARGLLSVLIVMTIAGLSLGSALGFVNDTIYQRRQNGLLERIHAARVLLATVRQARAATGGYVLTGKPAFLKTYYQAAGGLRSEADTVAPAIQTTIPRGAATLLSEIAREQALWDSVIAQAQSGAQLAAVQRLGEQINKLGRNALNETLDAHIDKVSARWDANRAAFSLDQDIFLILNAAGGAGTIVALIYAFRRSEAEAARREIAVGEALRAREAAIAGREEVRKIFAMAQALQSADSVEDGAAILRAGAIGLLPCFGGALYLFDTTRDHLDLLLAWTPDRDQAGAATAPAPSGLLPQDCWALKCTKPHLNGDGRDSLRCGHAALAGCSFEVPMIGRGEPVGLLIFTDPAAGGAARLREATEIACVLADSMSLGLASILLRDRLRDQAVRDSLTGLYNRRFLEEVMPNLVLQAQRRQVSLAVVMIDLDFFKRLNDEHGHAMGDVVLKLVAATLVAQLRSSDVACRYGGEELLVLLPDCTLETAGTRADEIRQRIAGLSHEIGIRVSASLGVSAMPATARDGAELVTSADAALYRAKEQGRNCVALAAHMIAPSGPRRTAAAWGVAGGSTRDPPQGVPAAKAPAPSTFLASLP